MRTLSVLVAGVAGCVPLSSQSTYERVVWNAAALPAPAGPQAAGPILANERVSLAGGAGATAVQGTGDSREQGAPGHIVQSGFVRGRLGLGVGDWAELALQGDVTGRGASVPVATDLSQDDMRSSWTMRFGPGVRMQTLGSGLVFGGVGEVEAGMLRWSRVTYVSEETTTWSPDDEGEGVDVSQWSASDIETEHQSEIFWYVRTGPYLAWRRSERTHLSAGLLFQNSPWFEGHTSQQWHCSSYTDGSYTGCEEPQEPEDFDINLVVTLYGSFSVDVGAAWLIFQAHANVADEYGGAAQTPYGASVALRFDFDAATPPPPPSTRMVALQ